MASIVGTSIDAVENHMAEYLDYRYVVALSCGTEISHLASKLVDEGLNN